MDTAKLELAAQRYRDARESLDSARADLRAEVVATLNSATKRGAQAQVARITGWTREQVRQLMDAARKEATQAATEEQS